MGEQDELIGDAYVTAVT